jgi:hypothetical protein
VQPEAKPGRDAEVAATPTNRPEELRVRVPVHVQHLAVGGDELRGEHVVDREAVLADEEADAAAEGEPPDSDRTGVSEPGGQPVCAGSGRVLARGQSRLRPGGVLLEVDLERSHVREVEHDSSFGDAVAREAVTAAADRQL